MTIDWSKAPEGATHWNELNCKFYKFGDALVYVDDGGLGWAVSGFGVGEYTASCFTPRPSESKPYTRDEALQFLVERLDSWPTDIADAPLCPGWGWHFEEGLSYPRFISRLLAQPLYLSQGGDITRKAWLDARPDFVPFVSLEDAQPATAKQPAPSGKGDPILGMVLADLTNRALEGREKYGEALKANNGRNALWDAYQEALDLAMYLRQAIEEQSK